MPFIVHQEHFEGPLDLLLSLIEKRKLFVSDITLAKVTDDFIAYIQTFENFPLNDSANFILIASTLLLIKSKSLLPTLDLTMEEEEGIHDLETRLKIYAEVKRAGAGIRDIFGKEVIFQPSQTRRLGSQFQSQFQSQTLAIFSPDPSMTLAGIAAAILNLIRALPKKEVLPKALVQKVVSLEEMIGRLSDRVTKSLKMSFREFSGSSEGKENRVHIIISFLAMLELVKQGIIHVTQERAGDDIHMETQVTGVPHYT